VNRLYIWDDRRGFAIATRGSTFGQIAPKVSIMFMSSSLMFGCGDQYVVCANVSSIYAGRVFWHLHKAF